jgi:hypothetical protein
MWKMSSVLDPEDTTLHSPLPWNKHRRRTTLRLCSGPIQLGLSVYRRFILIILVSILFWHHVFYKYVYLKIFFYSRRHVLVVKSSTSASLTSVSKHTRFMFSSRFTVAFYVQSSVKILKHIFNHVCCKNVHSLIDDLELMFYVQFQYFISANI